MNLLWRNICSFGQRQFSQVNKSRMNDSVGTLETYNACGIFFSNRFERIESESEIEIINDASFLTSSTNARQLLQII